MTSLASPPRPPDATVGATRRALAQAFGAAGLDAPALDACILIGHALALDHAGLAAAPERALSAAELARIEALASRRLAGEPVARILGVKEFWGLPLAVTPAVLSPRPETETVVETALAELGGRQARTRAWRIADLGTGSGAILVALLTELPRAYGIGTDRDAQAAATARDNAQRLGVAHRAAFVVCDYGAALAGGFDLVVANPPYIRSEDIARLAREVRDFDPRVALDGGPDGLDAYRALAADAGRLLGAGARLIIEIGAGQSQSVAQVLAASGLVVEPAARRDLSGIARVIVAARAAGRPPRPTSLTGGGKKELDSP